MFKLFHSDKLSTAITNFNDFYLFNTHILISFIKYNISYSTDNVFTKLKQTYNLKLYCFTNLSFINT